MFVCHLYGSSEDEFVGGLLPASSETEQADAGHRGHVEEQQGRGGTWELQLEQVQCVIFLQILQDLAKCFNKIGKMFHLEKSLLTHVGDIEWASHQ